MHANYGTRLCQLGVGHVRTLIKRLEARLSRSVVTIMQYNYHDKPEELSAGSNNNNIKYIILLFDTIDNPSTATSLLQQHQTGNSQQRYHYSLDRNEFNMLIYLIALLVISNFNSPSSSVSDNTPHPAPPSPIVIPFTPIVDQEQARAGSRLAMPRTKPSAHKHQH